MQLVGIQRHRPIQTGLGPPTEAALGKALLAHPKTWPIVDQTLDGMTAARAEDKERPAQGLAQEHLPTQSRQTIDAFAEIHWLDRQQDAHVRGDLDHRRRRKNSCTTQSSSLGLASGRRRTNRAPQARTTSTVTPSPPVGVGAGAGSSTKLGGV